jgi:hypothetical protein
MISIENILVMMFFDIDCSFYDRSSPIYTQPRYLPPSKMLDADITDSVIGEGCVIKVNFFWICSTNVRFVLFFLNKYVKYDKINLIVRSLTSLRIIIFLVPFYRTAKFSILWSDCDLAYQKVQLLKTLCWWGQIITR